MGKKKSGHKIAPETKDQPCDHNNPVHHSRAHTSRFDEGLRIKGGDFPLFIIPKIARFVNHEKYCYFLLPGRYRTGLY